MIHFITKAEAHILLSSKDKSGTYRGPLPEIEFDMFVVCNGDGTWDAIDNSSGDAWTENFDSLDKALAWLDDDRTKEDMEEDDKPQPSGSDRDYSEDDGVTDSLAFNFETAFDQDRLLNLHVSNTEFTELVTSSYEKITGESCVNWGYTNGEGTAFDGVHTDLPRPKDPDEYETYGYSEDFWGWMKNIEGLAIKDGVQTIDEMMAFFLGYLTPEAREMERRNDEALKRLEQPEPPHEDSLEEMYDRVALKVRNDNLAKEKARRDKCDKVNRAIAELFDMISFINKDGWKLYVCEINNTHCIQSRRIGDYTRVELAPSMIEGKFVPKGRIGKLVFENPSPCTIRELAGEIVKAAAEAGGPR